MGGSPAGGECDVGRGVSPTPGSLAVRSGSEGGHEAVDGFGEGGDRRHARGEAGERVVPAFDVAVLGLRLLPCVRQVTAGAAGVGQRCC